MAWSNGNKRWTVPFVSLNGTACRVDIYKRGYTGSTVTELSMNNSSAPAVAAADPFYYQEDDDEDLLSVIRVKTGYMRLVETVGGGLDDIFPQTNYDHYVEMYYANTLKFTGFMKALTFENTWGPSPREMEFTIVSPLGLATGMYFTKGTDPDFRTLGSIMREVVNGLDAGITAIHFPDPSNQGSKMTYCMFRMYLLSTVILPEDVGYQYGATAQDLFSARSYSEFLEGLCNCFGLIVHDEPNRLVFSRFDYDGEYASIPSAYLEAGQSRTTLSITGATTEDLATGTEVASNDNTESVILPMSKITIDYEGGFFKSAGIPWEHCRRRVGTSLLEEWDIATNTPLNHEISSDNLNNSLMLQANGRLSGPGVMFAAVGQGSVSPMILFQRGSSWNTGVPTIFKTTLYDRPNQSARISFDFKFGNSIEDLQNPGTQPTLHVFARCGMDYFTVNGWSKVAGYCPISIHADGHITCSLLDPPRGFPLEIWINCDLQYLSDEYIYTIQNFKVDDNISEIAEYVYGDNGSDHAEIIGSPSEQEANVTCLFSDQALTMNLLASRLNENVSRPSNPPYSAYRYMTIAQNRLIVTLRGNMPDYIYMKKILYYPSGWHWRIIAVSFNPWDDTHTLTLHRSPTI